MVPLEELQETIKRTHQIYREIKQLELEEEIRRNEGRYPFPALFDLSGNLVAAKEVKTRHGWIWGVLKTDSPNSRVIKWFPGSKARNGKLAQKRDSEQGYYVGYVLARATIALDGPLRYPVAVRLDDGFSRDVVVIDNGQGTEQGTWYELISEIG